MINMICRVYFFFHIIVFTRMSRLPFYNVFDNASRLQRLTSNPHLKRGIYTKTNWTGHRNVKRKQQLKTFVLLSVFSCLRESKEFFRFSTCRKPGVGTVRCQLKLINK